MEKFQKFKRIISPKRIFRIGGRCKTCEHKWQCRLKRNIVCYVLKIDEFKDLGVWRNGKRIR